jgi:hypothetical protein
MLSFSHVISGWVLEVGGEVLKFDFKGSEKITVCIQWNGC